MLETTNGQDPIMTGGEKQDPVKKHEIEADSYEKLLQEYDSKYRNLVEGEIISGYVVKVTDGEVIVDVGHKSEGIIPIHEFVGADGKVTVKPGDRIAVLMENDEGNMDGYLMLSRE